MRRWVLALLVMSSLALPGCSRGPGATRPNLCNELATVVESLSLIPSSEGDPAAAAHAFRAAARTFADSAAPPELADSWDRYPVALAYYADAAEAYDAGRGDEFAHRSEDEVDAWIQAFGRLTSLAGSECDYGWRTAYDGCSPGPAPRAADVNRLLLPCPA